MRKLTVTAFKNKAEKMVRAKNDGEVTFTWIEVLPYAACKGDPAVKARTGFVLVAGEGFKARKMIATAFTDGTFMVR